MIDTKDWTDVLLIIAPILIAVGGMYLLIKNLFERDYRLKLIETKRLLQKETLPLRLQALERMALFLERMTPESLIIRVMQPGMQARDLHVELLSNIRTEYEHNASQQVYLTSQTWELIKNAREEMVKLINVASSQVSRDSKAMELSSKIMEITAGYEKSPVQVALDALKIESAQLF